MKIENIIAVFEKFAPLHYQENYDNSGIQVGSVDTEINAALLCIDVTEKVVEEAIQLNAGLIISHHPLIFRGIKKITNATATERIITKAIKNNIAIYSSHTNLDKVLLGVNKIISDKLGLQNIRILSPQANDLKKLVTLVPTKHLRQVREAVFNAGAGHIGDYSSCSFNISGQGTFKASEGSTPFVGETGKLHTEEEIRFETIFPAYRQQAILHALIDAHPYEEVAYDIYPLDNENPGVGAGMIGELKSAVNSSDFLQKLPHIFKTKVIRYIANLSHIPKIKKVALCGGSGSFLIKDALKQKADIFITGDIKYHQFFEADSKLILVDIGHYESEQFTTEIFYTLIKEKFPNFATHFTKTITNPIKYVTI